MKNFFVELFITLLATISISYATLAAAQVPDHYPPQQIKCIRSEKFSCTIPTEDLPYLTVNTYAANAPAGIYTFKQGESSNSNTPQSVIIYTYQSVDGQYEVRLRTTYFGITADTSNPHWELIGSPKLGYYQCIATATSCPFTNTPYLKAK